MKKVILSMAALLCMGVASAKTVKTTFGVGGSCGMCKARIEKAAKAVDGVVSATWNQNKQTLSLVYDNKKTTPEKVQKELAKVGHDAGSYKADDKVYNALPGCCKYRK